MQILKKYLLFFTNIFEKCAYDYEITHHLMLCCPILFGLW